MNLVYNMYLFQVFNYPCDSAAGNLEDEELLQMEKQHSSGDRERKNKGVKHEKQERKEDILI